MLLFPNPWQLKGLVLAMTRELAYWMVLIWQVLQLQVSEFPSDPEMQSLIGWYCPMKK
jgi:hypothetical protein